MDTVRITLKKNAKKCFFSGEIVLCNRPLSPAVQRSKENPIRPPQQNPTHVLDASVSQLLCSCVEDCGVLHTLRAQVWGEKVRMHILTFHGKGQSVGKRKKEEDRCFVGETLQPTRGLFSHAFQIPSSLWKRSKIVRNSSPQVEKKRKKKTVTFCISPKSKDRIKYRKNKIPRIESI